MSTETITVTLKDGFGSSQAIDGLGILKRGEPKEMDAPQDVAQFFRTSTMFGVDPVDPPKAAKKKAAKKEEDS